MPDKLDPRSRNKISRRNFLRRLGGFISSHWLLSASLPLGGGLFGYASYSTLHLKSEQWDLSYPNLPPSLEGKTICQLSDLHLRDLRISPQDIAQIVQLRKPDLLVITGDLISSKKDLDKIDSYLGNLTATYGKYFVKGNHEHRNLTSNSLANRFLQQLKSLGWTPLNNAATFLSSLDLWIIGIDDPATSKDNVESAYKNAPLSSASVPFFRLVLAHSSDCLDDVAKYGAELMLTGHTHGGQIRLPGLPPPVINTYLGELGFYEGYHVINRIPLYVNRGIGESILPFRFFVPPEISFFTLHRGDNPPQHQTS